MSKIVTINVDLEFKVEDDFDLSRKDIDLRGLDDAYIETIEKDPYYTSDRIIYHTAQINSIELKSHE